MDERLDVLPKPAQPKTLLGWKAHGNEIGKPGYRSLVLQNDIISVAQSLQTYGFISFRFHKDTPEGTVDTVVLLHQVISMESTH